MGLGRGGGWLLKCFLPADDDLKNYDSCEHRQLEPCPVSATGRCHIGTDTLRGPVIGVAASKVLHMANLVFSESLCLYTFHSLLGCEIFPKHSPRRSFMEIVDRSHVTSSQQRFFKSVKNLKKTDKKTLT